MEKAVEEAQEYYAYISLGNFYENGDGIDKDGQKAYQMYEKAYQYGIKGEGAYYMGRMLFRGDGVPEDNAKAYQLFQEALGEDIQEANYFLGLLNYLDESENPVVEKNAETALRYLDAVPDDVQMQAIANERKGYICVHEGRIEEAKKYYETAAALGDTDAAEALARLEKKLEDQRREFIEYLRQSADINELLKYYEQGVNVTAFWIAHAYEYGEKGAEVDYAKALFYYQKVIEYGIGAENAYVQLGLMYQNGQGVPRDVSTAISCFVKASDKSGSACCGLGEIYRRGDGVTVDVEKAVQWHNKGAALGYAQCHVSLCEMYFQGMIGNKQDAEKGIIHLRKALELDPNHASACWLMAQFAQIGVVENGKEMVAKDIKQAARYYQIAAEKGNAEAYEKLGEIYSEPGGLLYDYGMAVKCYETAAEKGRIWSWAQLAALNLLPEFRNETAYNPEKGVEAAKKFLELGDGSRGLKEYVMMMMLDYFQKRGEQLSDYSRQGYWYLFGHWGTMGLAYTTEDNKQKLTGVIHEVCRLLTVILLDCDEAHGLERVKEHVWKPLEEMAEKNAYLKSCAQVFLREYCIKTGELHLENGEMEDARYCFECAVRNGSEEAEKYLVRFRTGTMERGRDAYSGQKGVDIWSLANEIGLVVILILAMIIIAVVISNII